MLLPTSLAERDRLKLIQQVAPGQLTQAKAAQLVALADE